MPAPTVPASASGAAPRLSRSPSAIAARTAARASAPRLLHSGKGSASAAPDHAVMSFSHSRSVPARPAHMAPRMPLPTGYASSHRREATEDRSSWSAARLCVDRVTPAVYGIRVEALRRCCERSSDADYGFPTPLAGVPSPRSSMSRHLLRRRLQPRAVATRDLAGGCGADVARRGEPGHGWRVQLGTPRARSRASAISRGSTTCSASCTGAASPSTSRPLLRLPRRGSVCCTPRPCPSTAMASV